MSKAKHTATPSVTSYSKAKTTANVDQVILHMDLDSFYAQAVCNLFPELHQKPVGIKQKNIVVTCNYLARQQGVTKLQYLEDAFAACPDMELVSGENLLQFRRASTAVFQCIRDFLGPAVAIERLGMDELFVDVTALVSAAPSPPTPPPMQLAEPLQDWQSNITAHPGWCGHVVCMGPADIWQQGGAPPPAAPLPPMPLHVGTAAATPELGSLQFPNTTLLSHSEDAQLPAAASCCCDSSAVQPALASGCHPSDYAPCSKLSGNTACCAALNVHSSSARRNLEHLRRASWLLAALRARLRSQVGLTASGGCGSSKLAAKLASSVRKPNGQSIVLPWSLHAFMHGVPLRSVPGVGYALRQRLKLKSLFFVQDVRQFPCSSLQSEFGEEVGAFLHSICWGVDPSLVNQQPPPKSISCEDAFQRCSSLEEAKVRLHSILRSWLVLLDDDASAHRRRPGLIKVSWRHARGARQSKQAAFPDTVPLGGADVTQDGGAHWRQVVGGSASRRVASSPRDERGALLLDCGVPSQVAADDARMQALMGAVSTLLGGGVAHAEEGMLHLTLLGVSASNFSPLAQGKGGRHTLNLRSMLMAQAELPRSEQGLGASATPAGSGRVQSLPPMPSSGQEQAADLTNCALSECNDSVELYLSLSPVAGGKRARSEPGGAAVPPARRPHGVSQAAWDKLPAALQRTVAATAARIVHDM